jgi:hypothetical protein
MPNDAQVYERGMGIESLEDDSWRASWLLRWSIEKLKCGQDHQ